MQFTKDKKRLLADATSRARFRLWVCSTNQLHGLLGSLWTLLFSEDNDTAVASDAGLVFSVFKFLNKILALVEKRSRGWKLMNWSCDVMRTCLSRARVVCLPPRQRSPEVWGRFLVECLRDNTGVWNRLGQAEHISGFWCSGRSYTFSRCARTILQLSESNHSVADSFRGLGLVRRQV